MSIPGPPDRRTPEERRRDEERRIAEHYLEEGRAYTFELSHTWYSGWFPMKIMTWGCFIKQAECPWSVIAYEGYDYNNAIPFLSLIARARAKRWGRSYLKRGGPPEGFFAPPPADPNMVVFQGSAASKI